MLNICGNTTNLFLLPSTLDLQLDLHAGLGGGILPLYGLCGISTVHPSPRSSHTPQVLTGRQTSAALPAIQVILI